MNAIYVILATAILSGAFIIVNKVRKRRQETAELQALVQELDELDESICLCCNADPNAPPGEPLDIPEEGIMRLLLDMEEDLSSVPTKKKA